jgi:hypothetical protein
MFPVPKDSISCLVIVTRAGSRPGCQWMIGESQQLAPQKPNSDPLVNVWCRVIFWRPLTFPGPNFGVSPKVSSDPRGFQKKFANPSTSFQKSFEKKRRVCFDGMMIRNEISRSNSSEISGCFVSVQLRDSRGYVSSLHISRGDVVYPREGHQFREPPKKYYFLSSIFLLQIFTQIVDIFLLQFWIFFWKSSYIPPTFAPTFPLHEVQPSDTM